MTTEPIHPHAPSLGEDKDGTIRIGTTRVPLETVIAAFWQGAAPEEIMLRFDVLTLPQIYEAISYYLNHREEADAYLEKQREKGHRVRRKLEAAAMTPGEGVRERLLRRKEAAERERTAPQKQQDKDE